MTVKTLGEGRLAQRVAGDGDRGGAGPPREAAAARAATIRSLQHVLEVLDGRRPVDHLLRTVTEDVFAQVRALLRRRPPNSGNTAADTDAARLLRVHVQLGAPARAEYFGTFVRGDRVRAVAGRLEVRAVRLPSKGGERRTEDRWTLVELSIV
ncbi:Rv3235 family protein [Gordonia neofelifaecis]|uniref:Uncharacterized protein n=1 Tax=Gordonia neofelifaecis NRRL B-59395 TaxID=644548 RepID=F1YJH2_9ACTN|nr:Rv3235 family protein [Gordonia neofelifaecis]EGD55205.1 hypothetical protein SCNU_10044 [Gordonia neofelifaecis NRRL B-59395]